MRLIFLRSLAAMSYLACLLLVACRAERSPGQFLRIVSPKSRTIVHPGEKLKVVVVADGAFEKVSLLGQSPLPSTDPVSRLPFKESYTFQIAIPRRLQSAGARVLTAVGAARPREVIQSDPIEIDIEPTGTVRIESEKGGLSFEYIRDRLSIQVTGILADGSTIDMTRSSMTSYRSEDPKVATVDKEGTVTAAGKGQTTIVVNGSWFIPVSVLSQEEGRK
jgi:hypothetical protein